MEIEMLPGGISVTETEETEPCIRQFVPSVEKIVRYRLSQPGTNRFTAVIVLNWLGEARIQAKGMTGRTSDQHPGLETQVLEHQAMIKKSSLML